METSSVRAVLFVKDLSRAVAFYVGRNANLFFGFDPEGNQFGVSERKSPRG